MALASIIYPVLSAAGWILTTGMKCTWRATSWISTHGIKYSWRGICFVAECSWHLGRAAADFVVKYGPPTFKWSVAVMVLQLVSLSFMHIDVWTIYSYTDNVPTTRLHRSVAMINRSLTFLAIQSYRIFSFTATQLCRIFASTATTLYYAVTWCLNVSMRLHTN